MCVSGEGVVRTDVFGGDCGGGSESMCWGKVEESFGGYVGRGFRGVWI